MLQIGVWWLVVVLFLFLAGMSPRSMKPRARLGADDFLQILRNAGGVVIRVSPSNRLRVLPPILRWIGAMFPWMYVVEGTGYYYYTYSKGPLTLPESAEVIDATGFHFF